jgi:hypothetical protein
MRDNPVTWNPSKNFYRDLKKLTRNLMFSYKIDELKQYISSISKYSIQGRTELTSFVRLFYAEVTKLLV